ncbi:uncharacterized protein [Salmo salar]|uniref:Uncharacterized protein n=1 Tax=Salmo salar TaxID=8030 RepID=A0A1S3MBQ7_SALSA|nr:uncharacterized protein LOC106571622 [Salmo salar]|eukprot:XP_014000391.1 PREDICTED: uncharacterized protein LOC106571622 [Salmo salar]
MSLLDGIQANIWLRDTLSRTLVYSTLTDQVRKNVKDIVTLSENDVRLAEEVIKVCKPLRTVTLICTKSIPSVSMVLPMKTMILKSMVACDEDEPAVRDVKTAIRVNLEPRYAGPGVQEFLHKSTALDPCLMSLRHMDSAARLRVCNELTAEIVTNIQQGQATDTTGANSSPETADNRGSPPENKSVMAELFGELFTTQEQGTKSKVKVIEEEVTSYREVDFISLDALEDQRVNIPSCFHVSKALPGCA